MRQNMEQQIIDRDQEVQQQNRVSLLKN